MEMFKNFNLPKNFEEHNLKQNLIKYALLVLAAQRYTGLFHNSINCKEVPSPNFEIVPTQKKKLSAAADHSLLDIHFYI